MKLFFSAFQNGPDQVGSKSSVWKLPSPFHR